MVSVVRKIKAKKQEFKEVTPLKLNIGCGANPVPGFKGIDISDEVGADYVFDVRKYPWPFKNESVEEVFSSHFLEHLTGLERIPFMNEVYRILKAGGKALFVTPYWNSIRAVQDPTHAWPPVSENFYLYTNKEWREMNKLGHYDFNCDFDFTFGYSLDPLVAARNPEYQQEAVKYFTNSVTDLHVTLTKKVQK